MSDHLRSDEIFARELVNAKFEILHFFNIAMQNVPLKKMTEPEEIGALVSYLLSQTSMTGQTIDINAGSVMNS